MDYSHLLNQAKELTASTDPQVLVQVAKHLQSLTVPTTTTTVSEFPTFSEFLKNSTYHDYRYGPTGFKPYNYQIELADILPHSKFTMINHARQMGITHMLSIYGLWYGLKYPGSQVMLVSNKFGQALDMIDRIRGHYTNSQFSDIKISNKANIELMNGSKIICSTPGSTMAKGTTFDLIVMDGAAYYSYATDDFTSDITNMHLGCTHGNNPRRLVMASTPNKTSGIFYDSWMKEHISATKIQLPYGVHPDRNSEWLSDIRMHLDLQTFTKEYECTFNKS